MKIGVLGAPGAGKTKFASGLAKQLGIKHRDQSVKVVDGYVQNLQKRTGLALGPWASYAENMMIAGNRESARLVKKADNQITVGTIMDTMVYCMVHSDVVFHNDTMERRRLVYEQTTQVVDGLKLWYTQTWDYDLCFWLSGDYGPHDRSIITQFHRTLDQAYTPVLESFYVPNVFGLDGEVKERVGIASEVIREFEAIQRESEADASVLEERGLRAGGEDGTKQRDSAGPVPDVS